MISQLSSGELLLLCRGALERWKRLLVGILDHSDPSDAPLRQLLLTRKLEEEASALRFRHLNWSVSLSAGPSLRIVTVDATLKATFPAGPLTHGEGHLSRDTALYKVELLEEERLRFFRLVRDTCAANGTAHEIAVEHEKSRRNIEHLHTVILSQPPLALPSGTDVAEDISRRRLPSKALTASLNSLIHTIGVHMRTNGRSESDRPNHGRPREIQDLFRDLLARLDPLISETEPPHDAEPLVNFTIEMAWLIKAGALRGSLAAAQRFLGLLLKRDPSPGILPDRAAATPTPETSALSWRR